MARVEPHNWFVALENLAPFRVVLLIFLFAFLAYANSLGGDFVFDDTEQIVENHSIRSWDNLAKAFTSSVWAFREEAADRNAPPSLPYYRPLFTVLLTVGYQLFGLWPQGWHLMSLMLHIICSAGVYFVILTLSRRNAVAIFSSLLFAVYPLHAESVCWASGITDPLYGAFFLASFYFYLKFSQQQQAERGSRQSKSSRMLIWSLVLFTLALYSKETALSLIILIFGYELIKSSGDVASRLKAAALSAAPYFAAAFIYLIPRYLVLGENMWSNSQIAARPFAHTLLTLPFILCSYVFHLIWPVGLSITYNTHFVTSFWSLKFILPTLLLALGIITSSVLRKRISRDVWIAALIIFAPLLPVLKIGEAVLEEYLISDRYLYISVAGWVWLMSLGLIRFIEPETSSSEPRNAAKFSAARLKLGFSVIVALVILLTGLTARENLAWADSYSLWSNAARARPAYWAPHYNRGLALLDMNKPADALAALQQAVSLKSDEPNVFDALGRAHAALGDREEAIKSFEHALELSPRMTESLNNLGTVYFDMGNYAQAERYFKESILINPKSAVAYFNLGQCYSRQTRYIDSAREFEKYLRAVPMDAQAHYELGLVYEKSGRKEDAIHQFQTGLDAARSKELAVVISNSLDRIRREK
jgi:tetratricopeptide (TPR) repeat protein